MIKHLMKNEDIEFSLSRELPQYTVKVLQVRKPRGKILGQKKDKVFDVVESVSKNI